MTDHRHTPQHCNRCHGPACVAPGCDMPPHNCFGVLRRGKAAAERKAEAATQAEAPRGEAEGSVMNLRQRARKKTAKRKRPSRQTLERWLDDLNEWRWPVELPSPITYDDGKDDIRGAYKILAAVLRVKS